MYTIYYNILQYIKIQATDCSDAEAAFDAVKDAFYEPCTFYGDNRIRKGSGSEAVLVISRFIYIHILIYIIMYIINILYIFVYVLV